jgi:hypothetical protein
VLADTFIPFTPILPIAQVALLIVIVIIEALVIRRYTDAALSPKRLWVSVTGANIITTLIGVALVFPLMWLEFRLAFEWGSQYREHPLLWWFSCIVYGFVLPYAFLIFCYVVSWRTEFALLARWLPARGEDIHSLRSRTIFAHRISYGILAIPVLVASLWYATILFDRA